MDQKELAELAASQKQPAYRGRQLYAALYGRRVKSFDEVPELPRNFRQALAQEGEIGYPEIKGRAVSQDGSVKYLFGLVDGRAVETVFMPEDNRATICVSSQAGCAADCRFCFTALLGLQRNLTAGEIVGQALAVIGDQHLPQKWRLNIVFMGMGEPLLNYTQVMKAVRLLADPSGLGIPLRRITVSTVGVVPKIVEFAQEPVRPKLAISLNASSAVQRTELMPITRKYSLGQLLDACRKFPLRPRERLTFEYVLIAGMNDSDRDAARVIELLQGIRSKVNLIPYNGGAALPYRAPRFDRITAFQRTLISGKVPAFVRVSRGQDVMAACGQLSLSRVPSNRIPALLK